MRGEPALPENVYMIPTPRRQNIISSAFHTIIDWAFGQSSIDVVLGGSCALSEFYLGHRIPEDIDLFVSSKEDLRTIRTALSRSFEIQHEEVIRKAVSYRYLVECERQNVMVHCVLSEKLAAPRVRRLYTTECESIQLHAPDFIGAWKLSKKRQESLAECTKKLLDVYSLIRAGLTFSDLLSVFRIFNIEPRNVLNWPYRNPCGDPDLIRRISLKPVSPAEICCFIEEFRIGVEAILEAER